ncbi:LamG-like jellyroll fold domain-containing protein [Chitinophaga sp. RAB17]|uniref:LamG-like jellyroll fold domain-containing protein n=1 Tax=Chitinophaga sp. RAB17 TaxID=3233049 RepID=UPI003F93D828
MFILRSTYWFLFNFFVIGFFANDLRGQNAVVVHYNFGHSGEVTYANGPDTIRDLAHHIDLKKTGQPVFFADAPADRKLMGEGALLFKNNAGYNSLQTIDAGGAGFVMEVWAQANSRQDAQQRDKDFKVLAGYGNDSLGYLIGQMGNSWSVLIDGRNAGKNMGTVVPGEWVHIALVVKGRKTIGYINGVKTLEADGSVSHAPAFFNAGAVGRKSSFDGLIYEMRLSKLTEGKFDPRRHLLYNGAQIVQQRQLSVAQQQAMISGVLNTPGVKRVTEWPLSGNQADWLVERIHVPAQVLVQPAADGLSAKLLLTNGLLSREFYISGNIACTGFSNLSDHAEYIRAVKPEARVMIDSTWFNIGGLSGQPEKSYLMDSWLKDLVAEPSAFRFDGIELKQPEVRYPWQQKYNAVHADWPPKGVHVIMHYKAPLYKGDFKKDVEVLVHYELYEGIPVIAKWVTVENKGGVAFTVQESESEVLAVNQDQIKRLHVESDYSFALVNADTEGSALMHYKGTPPAYQVGRSTTDWRVDKEYNTWASHNQAEDRFLGFPHHNLMVSRMPMGPNETVLPRQQFTSFVTFELLHDSDDRERQSLAHRRFYRTLAPQVTESLLTGGITSHDRVELKNFIDQMGELGFERLDIMAWPGISHDNLDSAYVGLWKEIAHYAAAKGIIMGGYELQVASRGRGAAVDCIDPQTGKPGSLFGQSVCVASEWQDTYYPKMWKFFDKTGFMCYTVDGPYHGDVCASLEHPHHHNLYDSQWEQWKQQVRVLHEAQRRNMYAAIPDWYFLNGQSATGMGYREASANLTPQQQLLLGRQYIYDGTWHKAPTMGWMTLQLVGFYTGDPRVGLEPLSQHLDRYEVGLFQHLASGCQFTLRGKRLYDTPETKAMVAKWTNWFKQHRAILTSDIIHIARPTGRDLDAMFHVNSSIEEKGMLVIFNPTDKAITRQMKVPVYYTGITGNAKVTDKDGNISSYAVDAHHEISLQVSIPPGGYAWYVVKE